MLKTRELDIVPFTAGSTVTAGFPVFLASDQAIDNCADDATAALGWALDGGDATATINVLLGLPNRCVTMPYQGTPAVLGRHVGLEIDSGVAYVKMDEVTADLFKLVSVNTDATTCEVVLLQAAYQLGASEVTP